MQIEDLPPADAMPFSALNQQLGGTLALQAYFGSGSTARVYHVKQRLGLGDEYRVDRIAKVFRHDSPDLPPLATTGMFLKEVQTLLSVAHTNVVSLYDAGSLQLTPTSTTHYFLMEYLPGGQDLDRALIADPALLAGTRDVRGFTVSLLLQIAHGLHGLHSQGVLHCDLKLGNILLGGGEFTRTAKITDFGFSKHVHGDSLRLDGATATTIYTTLDYLPTKYRKHPFLKLQDNPNRVLVSIPKMELSELFDLHYFGVILRKLLGVNLIAQALSVFDTAYLERMATRLSLDHPREPHKYGDVEEVIRDLRKLDKNYVAVAGLPEVSPLAAARIVRLPVIGNVAFTERVKQIVDHPWFGRLNTAMQLGYTYLVFPGATHTRFEHSLGVLANTAQYLQALLGSSASPAFRQLVTEEMLDTTLLAALLHDIAQHSFAHTLEDDLNFARHERAARAFLTGQNIGDFLPEPLAAEPPLARIIETYWPTVRMDVLLWMVAKDTPPNDDLPPAWRLMRSIIDGPLDADKMDYLLRDAHHAGVEYAGSIDVHRLLSSLCGIVELTSETADAECRAELGITWKGQVSAENLSIARFNMFRVLYWHHTVRSAHAMVGRACGLHLLAAGPQGRVKLNHALYTVPIHQISEKLEQSPDAETKRLGTMLRRRQLFKRLKEYSYRESAESDEIYKLLSDIREAIATQDPAFVGFCGDVASDINKHVPGANLEAKHILLDIPKPGKDDIGNIRFVGKEGGLSRKFHTDILEGQAQDWAKYARKIRVFIDPSVSTATCDDVRRVINGAFRRVGAVTLERRARAR